MARNMALKRSAKANRRKAVVVEKRKSELLADTLTARVARAARAPIQHCLLVGNRCGSGMAAVILARGVTSLEFMVGGFLIDTWRLGVKDAFFGAFDSETFDDLLDEMAMGGGVEALDPAHARKLLRDVTAWAASNGFAPHRDFAVIDTLFGDVSADACKATFTLVRDGGQIGVSWPNEPAAEVPSIMPWPASR